MADDELRLRMTAIDDVSDVLDEVGNKADRLDGSDAKVGLTADDNASAELDELRRKVEGLDGEDAEVVVRAELKKAERDVRTFERQLADVAGTDAQAEVTANTSAARARVKEIRGLLDDLHGRKVEAEVSVDDTAGEQAGGAFHAGFLKKAAPAVIGAAIVGGINEGFERLRSRALFAERFGLSREEGRRLGREAGEVFVDGFGESLDQVRTALGEVDRRLENTGQIGAHETEKIAKGALGIAEVFGEDVDAVIRAASQLMLNGLAPNAEKALDIITTGFQNGNNVAGDWLDTINEYSQQWADLGISGEDALAKISAGIENGQRDTDKIADALKEMRIRLVEDSEAGRTALDELGLSADAVRDGIAQGGPAAKAAFTQVINAIAAVKDPAEQQRVAVQLLGTQYEDLGSRGIDALAAVADQTTVTKDATDDLVASLQENQNEIDRLKRRASAAFGSVLEFGARQINDVLDGGSQLEAHVAQMGAAIEEASQAIDRYTGPSDELAKHLAALGFEADIVAMAIDRYSERTDEAKAKTEQYDAWARRGAAGVAELEHNQAQANIAMGQAARRADTAARSAREKAKADEEAETAARDHNNALRDQYVAAQALVEQQSALVGGALGVERAQITASKAANTYKERIDELTASGLEGKELEEEKRLAFIDAIDAQTRAAQTAADYEIAQREANGEVLTAQERARVHAEQLRNVAAELAPDSPLRQELLDYATELLGIPDSVLTDLGVDADFETLARFDQMIRNVPDLKETTIRTIFENVNRDKRFQENRFGDQSHVGSHFAAGQGKMIVPGQEQYFEPSVPGYLPSMEEAQRRSTGTGGTVNNHTTLVVQGMSRDEVLLLIDEVVRSGG